MQGSHTSSVIYFPADYYWFSQLPDPDFVNTKTVTIDGGRPYLTWKDVRCREKQL